MTESELLARRIDALEASFDRLDRDTRDALGYLAAQVLLYRDALYRVLARLDVLDEQVELAGLMRL